jgi:biotin carboxyl carrier protein
MESLVVNKIFDVKSPMPGLVLEVNVAPGAEVKKGDSLVILEAMKMENVIKSPADGIIKEVFVKPTEAVEKNVVLISFE